MSTKFFTNEESNTLLNKIKGVFEYKNIHFFDALVGYFRATGYFQIRDFVEKAAEIRVLVGINIDKLVLEAHQQGLLFNPDSEKVQEEFFRSVRQNIQEAKYDRKVEDGMLQLIEDIVSGKLKIKIHPKQNIHAKIYIFREKVKHDHGYGSVITGSSNLTEAGLGKNFEFNVELRENTDIDFATETFNKLWDEGVPVDISYIEKLKKDTYLNDEYTPYEIYLKFLVEYFGKSIEFDPNSVTDLPRGFKRLSYQIDAVNDGYAKMMKHNGFFLADVVGLGKTVVAILIAKKYFYSNGFPEYRSRTLIIVPPSLKENWTETVEQFNLDNVKITTNGSLHKVRNYERYDLVIVDEAHKFRTDTAIMYNELQKICKSPTKRVLPDGTAVPKRVILVSATPLNNKPEDIANLVYLFQDSKNSTLETGNLQHFFRSHIDTYKKLKDEPNIDKVQETVKRIYEKIRVKIIEPLTVRRTRTDLMAHELYSKDLKKQGIHFPVVKKPEKILYKLDDELEALYDQTIFVLGNPVRGLKYHRYQAIAFLKPHKKQKYRQADMISGQLTRIMKTLLVKRIDSSFYAFKQSLHRFMKATEAMVSMFEKGRIFIAPNLPVSEMVNDEREDELMEMVLEQSVDDPTIDICSPDDFEPEFLPGLKHDYELLKELDVAWQNVTADPKLDKFISYLESSLMSKEINPQSKLVVFSESKETTQYLMEELPKHIPYIILSIDSTSRKDRMPIVRKNFDANIPPSEQEDRYDIILTTEVLAEGVNLHRANVIVNYDTPWNSTRLMQRIGRVNRIGSKAREVHVFNFYPTTNVNNDIELEKKAIMKLQAFHAALGEDSQIYSPDEEIESFGLFDRDPEDDRDEKLEYLMELRRIKQEKPDLFKKIKNMPLRARVGRIKDAFDRATICYIKDQKRDAFIKIDENQQTEELTFLETAKIFEARSLEKGIPLHNLHHDQVQKGIQLFQDLAEAEKAREKKVDRTQGPNEKRAVTYLDTYQRLSITNEEERKMIISAKEAIQQGKFQRLQRDINRLKKTVNKSPLKPAIVLEKIMEILRSYPLGEREEDKSPIPASALAKAKDPAIIISESFVKS